MKNERIVDVSILKAHTVLDTNKVFLQIPYNILNHCNCTKWPGGTGGNFDDYKLWPKFEKTSEK
jgi:hypothetical protein